MKRSIIEARRSKRPEERLLAEVEYRAKFGGAPLFWQGDVIACAEFARDLRAAARDLREAQKKYMDDRGNEELGQQVAAAAAKVSAVLAR